MLLLALAAPACSTLPVAAFPPYVEHRVEAEYVVPPSGRLLLPASSPQLVVLALELLPPPDGERFRADRRWFTYAPGTRVTVRGRVRAYSPPGAPPPAAATLFDGAARLRLLDAP